MLEILFDILGFYFFSSVAFNFLIPEQKPLTVCKLGSITTLIPNAAPPERSAIFLICFTISILSRSSSQRRNTKFFFVL